MSKYLEIPSQSLISSYGGIGSLIETTLGSLMILPLEKWPFFINEIKDKDADHVKSLAVKDPRLIHRLRSVFPDLKYLLKVPVNDTFHNGNGVTLKNHIIAAQYFPLWMFCPRCYRFMRYQDWEQRYRDARLGNEFDRLCPECRKPKTGSKPLRIMLEQVRFILISPEGKIQDIDWNEWFDQMASGVNSACRHDLKYGSSPYDEDLESIRITCAKCKASANMKGLFGKQIDGGTLRTTLRSSNSVYFPAILYSLMIPLGSIDPEDGRISEMRYRCYELDYMKASTLSDSDDDRIDLKAMPDLFDGVALISVRYLRMASVLCSYSRVQPISSGGIFQSERSVHVTNSGFCTQYLPCTESAGEGFLLTFEDKLIKEWYFGLIVKPETRERIRSLQDSLSSLNLLDIPEDDDYTLCKYVLLHTISHLLIKQLEYICGYSAASLSERLYCSPNEHAGIMVYTVAGSEGSYGGIVTLVEKGGLKELMASAYRKAMYCVNDPVCYKNTSVCFSCSLLPETSCEAFNSLLDRSFVVDQQYGFGKHLGI